MPKPAPSFYLSLSPSSALPQPLFPSLPLLPCRGPYVAPPVSLATPTSLFLGASPTANNNRHQSSTCGLTTANQPERVRLYHGAGHLAPARPVHEAHVRRPQLLHAGHAVAHLRGWGGVARLLPVAQGHAGRAGPERGHERHGLRAEHAYGEAGGGGHTRADQSASVLLFIFVWLAAETCSHNVFGEHVPSVVPTDSSLFLSSHARHVPSLLSCFPLNVSPSLPPSPSPLSFSSSHHQPDGFRVRASRRPRPRQPRPRHAAVRPAQGRDGAQGGQHRGHPPKVQPAGELLLRVFVFSALCAPSSASVMPPLASLSLSLCGFGVFFFTWFAAAVGRLLSPLSWAPRPAVPFFFFNAVPAIWPAHASSLPHARARLHRKMSWSGRFKYSSLV